MATDSILDSTKKVLGIDPEYDVFDQDVMLHINSAFSTLAQLGIGPEHGYMIQDEHDMWDTFLGGDARLNMVKTYVYLRVRMLFDPPNTSYLMEAIRQQIQELEWRISVHRENTKNEVPVPAPQVPVVNAPLNVVADGGWA